ncbi:Putative 2-aminoethylphosphonate transport system permease protein PhnV [BD1-7 clade bacterium]|uniref:2-aminoethylphosphonate transport system permease protein PhnV n=1 Tax=BD1-7 clade bacterium TaxID=2029982 RepID=A0A5S9QB10_9GAMM|nr:Putative 2-aminoethylphosphonate transport system permease protein PhnV [BD1-7 clade bacterium]
MLKRHYLLLAPVVLLVLVPIIAVFSAWTEVDTSLWRHFLQTRLPELLWNTILLMVLVGAGVVLVGVGLAWLICRYDFVGRRWLEWALILPMAVPAYVMAFVYLGVFDYSGPLQSLLRDAGLEWLTVNDIRNPVTVALVMTSVLYPYVYLLARNAFLNQSASMIEAAQSLGASPRRVVWTVQLGMARPAIVAGLALALMETLADFGTVAIFNYDTFTVAIYKAWFDYFDLQLACQLASLLLTLVFVALLLEGASRGRKTYAGQGRQPQRKSLTGLPAIAVLVLISSVLLLSFVLPSVQLVIWALNDVSAQWNSRFYDLVWHTLVLAVGAAILTASVALGLALMQRFQTSRWVSRGIAIAKLGYALPGTVLAVGIVVPLGWFEKSTLGLKQSLSLGPDHWILGSVFALLMAYMIRFLTVGFGPLETSFSRISQSLPEAARSLGASRLRVFRQVYLPLVRPGLALAILLVFVDVMKEMPATLLMRPFGWDTLAVRIYELTSEGEYQLAALPALCLLVVGLIPIALTLQQQRHQTRV